MNLKELKKLADACRKAGIKTFKNADVEFTLSDEMPEQNVRKLSQKAVVGQESNIVDDAFKADTLTEAQLLMWSTGALPEDAMPEGNQ